MKIAILSTFYPYRGGIAQFNGALFQSLKSLGHNVVAFNFSLQYPQFLFPGSSQYVTEDDKVVELDSKRILNSVNPISYFKTAKQINNFNPDVLVIGYWMPLMGPAFGTVLRKLNKSISVVAIVHNARPHEQSKFDKVLSHYFFSRVNKFIALSNAVEQQLKENYPKAESIVFHHPVYNHFGEKVNKSEAIQYLDLNKDAQYILFFGLIRAYKGLDILVEALSLLPENVHLIVAGECYEDSQKYRNLISTLKLENRIVLNDFYINDDDVKFYFSVAECCVLPYKSASQSGVISIAKHFNTPIIASNIGGLSEFLGDDDKLVNDIEPKAFAQTIRNFLSDDITKSSKEEPMSWTKFANALVEYSKI